MQNTVPLPAEGFIRLPQLLQVIPISKTTLWRKIKAGEFPKPHMLGPRTKVWDVEELRLWKQHIVEGQEYDSN